VLKDPTRPRERVKKLLGESRIVARFERRLTVFNRFDEHVIGPPRPVLRRRASSAAFQLQLEINEGHCQPQYSRSVALFFQ